MGLGILARPGAMDSKQPPKSIKCYVLGSAY